VKRINILLLLLVFSGSSVAQPDAREIIEAAMDMMRGGTSYTEMSMVIHRPDWERTTSMQTWTEGIDNSIVRVTAPAKDAGNGSLLKDNNMWSYAPKINRVIKVPSSMMNQSWMGSDLSNKDISKSTDIIDQYQHTLIDTIQVDDHELYVIESIPNEDAAVVWGKEVLTIRDDFVLLEQQYWDQEGALVKSFKTSEVEEMGGRQVATVLRMQDVDKPNQWTEMRITEVQFDVDLAANIFTLSNLRNPRQ
jgi:outer membrane lipoprotein-sorting protein